VEQLRYHSTIQQRDVIELQSFNLQDRSSMCENELRCSWSNFKCAKTSIFEIEYV